MSDGVPIIILDPPTTPLPRRTMAQEVWGAIPEAVVDDDATRCSLCLRKPPECKCRKENL